MTITTTITEGLLGPRYCAGSFVHFHSSTSHASSVMTALLPPLQDCRGRKQARKGERGLFKVVGLESGRASKVISPAG